LGIITNMVVAILMVHSQVGFFMNWSGNQKGEGFEFHLLAIAVGLAVLVKGAGALSIDQLLTHRASVTADSGSVARSRESGHRAS